MKKVLVFVFLISNMLAQGRDVESLYKETLDVYRTQSLDSAKIAAADYLKIVKEENDKFYQIKAYFLLAYICSRTEKFGDAVIYYLEAARIGEELGTDDTKKELISIYKNLASILGDYKHYELAYQFVDKGLELAEASGNTLQVISLNKNRIGDLLEEEKYQEALDVITTVVDRFDAELNMKSRVDFKNLEGITYKNLGNLKLARGCYQYILDQGVIDEKIYSFALHNMGTAYFMSNQMSLAIEFFAKAVEFEKNHDLINRLLLSLKDIGDTYHTIGQYELALAYLEQAEQIEREHYINHPDNYELYRLTSEVYEKIDNPEKALEYERIYTEKLEAFIAEQKKIEELDKKHNIQLLTQRYFDLLAAEEKRRETERLAKLGLGGSGILVIIIFTILLRQWWTRISIQRQIRDIEINSKV